jgi:hypothetical protein
MKAVGRSSCRAEIGRHLSAGYADNVASALRTASRSSASKAPSRRLFGDAESGTPAVP